MKKIQIGLTLLFTLLFILGLIWMESHIFIVLISLLLACLTICIVGIIVIFYFGSGVLIEQFNEKYGKKSR